MNPRFPYSGTWSASRIPVVALGLCFVAGAAFGASGDKPLYYNQDSTQFFATDFPDGRAGEAIDRYVDEVADAGVTVFLCNTNARRANYRSRAWDAFWDGYDPSGPDDQPFLAPAAKADVPVFRKIIHNMWKVHQEGVDYPARVIARCRQRGMVPWITLRMNDCHNNDVLDHPFHGRFWVENPRFRRQNCTGYFANCLDFAHREVRDYYMSLIEETLDRYDVDGLELDFLREPYLFSANKEQEGAPVLTSWLREIHRKANEAAVKRGHPIRLGVRMPSRPETALGMGLDAVTWAREGLVDLLVVTPRWATLEFGMAIPEWRRQLGDSKVTLVGGLEVLYRPMPGGPAEVVTPELARGAASLVLADGADAVYLFNYFPGTVMANPVYRETLRAMTSPAALRDDPRTVGVTYRDVVAPGESYQAPLPSKGKEAIFAMKLGPEPPATRRRELTIGVRAESGEPPATPLAFVDGNACDFMERKDAANGGSMMTFRIPVHPGPWPQTHEVKIVGGDGIPIVIERVEVAMKP